VSTPTRPLPVLFRDLFKILESNPGKDPATANTKLHLLGWNGVALEYQSLPLTLAWMDIEK
jgi:hypothetical protein